MKMYAIVFWVLLCNHLSCYLFAPPDCQDQEELACKKVRTLVSLPHQKSNATRVHWTSFVDDLIDLLDGLSDYESLCKDLKVIRTPRGFRTLKLILIAKRLNNHQELFKKMCEREEPLSFREGCQIAKYIRF